MFSHVTKFCFILFLYSIPAFSVAVDYKYDPFELPKIETKTIIHEWDYILSIHYLTSQEVTALLSRIYTSVAFDYNEQSRLLAIHTTPRLYRDLRQLLEKWDLPKKMIKISVTVLEISQQQLSDLGIEWNTQDTVIQQGILRTKEDILATIKILERNGKASILARPEITSLPNQEAQIKIGEKVPYAIPATDRVESRWTIQYINAGITVKVTPEIVSGNRIKALIHPEVSSIKEWKATQAGEFPILSTREMDVSLIVDNGQTMVLGGLINSHERHNESRVPFLADLPWIGYWFCHTITENEQTEIVFLVTFTIIEP